MAMREFVNSRLPYHYPTHVNSFFILWAKVIKNSQFNKRFELESLELHILTTSAAFGSQSCHCLKASLVDSMTS